MIPLLALTGLLFIFLEFFLPGAVMAVGGSIMLIASLVLFYGESAGWLFFCGYAALLGGALFLTIRIAMMKIRKAKLMHGSDQEDFRACGYPKDQIGKRAVALSDLKPSGYISIDEKSFSALSQLGYIEKGSQVRIIGGQGAHLIVTEEKDHANI